VRIEDTFAVESLARLVVGWKGGKGEMAIAWGMGRRLGGRKSKMYKQMAIYAWAFVRNAFVLCSQSHASTRYGAR